MATTIPLCQLGDGGIGPALATRYERITCEKNPQGSPVQVRRGLEAHERDG
jgi:hypothetical protein